MDIQPLILKYYRELLLIAGSLMLFLGMAPIMSEKYYRRFHESKWDDKFWPFSQSAKYRYGRYIQPSALALAGLTLVLFVICKL
jgi:hypothetical protein